MILELGVPLVAEACSVSVQAVYKWLRAGRLPRTEWTRDTNYAGAIAALSGGKYQREHLLPLSKSAPEQESPLTA